MTNTKSYYADDLALVVWPRQSEPAVASGQISWEEAARSAWAMDADKANRVTILVAVFDDKIVGAWAATPQEPEISIPAGKSRNVSRSSFVTTADDRLSYLVGNSSPWHRRRNPQMTLEVRDLPGADSLIADTQSTHGIVRLGGFTLNVAPNGTAELQMPAGAELTVRTSD